MWRWVWQTARRGGWSWWGRQCKKSNKNEILTFVFYLMFYLFFVCTQ